MPSPTGVCMFSNKGQILYWQISIHIAFNLSLASVVCSANQAGCRLSSSASFLVSKVYLTRRPLGFQRLYFWDAECSTSHETSLRKLLRTSFVSSVHHTCKVIIHSMNHLLRTKFIECVFCLYFLEAYSYYEAPSYTLQFCPHLQTGTQTIAPFALPTTNISDKSSSPYPGKQASSPSLCVVMDATIYCLTRKFPILLS